MPVHYNYIISFPTVALRITALHFIILPILYTYVLYALFTARCRAAAAASEYPPASCVFTDNIQKLKVNDY